MFRKFLNNMLANGLLFTAIMFNIMSAAITTMAFLAVAIVIKWVHIKI